MLSLKHILVATDFSAISVAALRHALGIARRYQSNVSVLHIIDPAVYGEFSASLRNGGCSPLAPI